MRVGLLDKGCFQNKACLVVGDIILDKYITGQVNRISPEAPIPVVKVAGEKYILGGAGNVAGNICGYHMKAYLCGLLGDDENGVKVQNLLAEKNIEFVGCVTKKRCTTTKMRIVGMNQQLVRVDTEDTYSVKADEEEILLEKIKSILPKVQIVVLSDYNKGVCGIHFCEQLMELCKAFGIRVIVDPKSNDWTKYAGAYLITPNFKEFQEVVGRELANEEAEIASHADEIMNRYAMQQILITRSQYGMTLARKSGEAVSFQAVQQEVYDVSGAGDTVIATIGACLAADYALEDALKISNYAAGLAVSKAGTYMVSLEEVLEYINRIGTWYTDKIVAGDRVPELVRSWKNANEKIVFTNGCFDILHIGHIDYLNQARMLGSKMIVGVNSDSSVQKLKGPKRPINNEQARTLSLAALQCVDAVVIFNEETPENLIRMVQPDYLVKGGDYRIEDIVGRQYAGEVKTIPLTEGYSTTKLIEKIRQE